MKTSPKPQPPQALIVWDEGGIKIRLWGTDTVPLSQVERASFILQTEILKARARLAHRKPAKREAGWDQPKEQEVKDVAQA